MKIVDFWNLPYYDKDDLKYYVIVFTKESFQHEYTLEERSYAFSSDNKWFCPCMCGKSLFANCLDKKDKGVRLDWYFGEWEIEYCYEISKEEYEAIFR